MKQKYIRPEFCTEPAEVGHDILVSSNEGYDVDIVDPGFDTY